MDPLSALGIASGVITFLDFAAKLVSTSTELYQSADGASLENLELEKVYEQMLDLSASLQLCTSRVDALEPGEETDGLRELSVSCHDDCEELLECLRGLRIKEGGQRSWRSLAAAFRSILGRKKLDALERRVQRVRDAISLHLSSMLL
jgi:hypothetical protein